jgi:hypothetical protein
MVVWPIAFLACGEAEHLGGGHMVERCCSPQGSQEAKGETKGQGSQ